jgi:predicted Zn finger-like uncharacterized protein
MIEIAKCPSCQRALRVSDDLVGQSVKCPACGTIFTANPAGGASAEEAPPREPAREREPEPRRGRSDRVTRRDEEDEDRPRRYGYEEERRSRRGRRYEDDYEEDDYDDRPRRRYKEHRGGLILALGILSLFFAPLILGPIAWIMGSTDLQEIRAGRMDPAGESNTSTGRILGMVSTLLSLFCIVGVLGLICMGALGSGFFR